MDVGVTEAVVAFISAGTSGVLVWKFTADRLERVEKLLEGKMNREFCELKHQSLDSRLDRIEGKLDELKADRRTEMQEMKALLLEYLNEHPRTKK